MSPSPNLTAAALPVAETASKAYSQPIQPLGEQIIIRTIPVGSIGSILIPDSAKSITMMSSKERPASDFIISADLLKDLELAISGKRFDFRNLKGRIDAAKKVPLQADTSSAVHFVEAVVIAVGPGKRQKGDPTLVEDLLRFVTDKRGFWSHLTERAKNQNARIAPLVKPGDHILYHPAVQKFDRDITAIMQSQLKLEGEDPQAKYFIIREESVLARIDP